MKTQLILAAIAALLLTTTQGHARAYGVTAGGRAYAAGPRGAAVAGPHGAAVARRPVGVAARGGYIRALPAGYATVMYGGYRCAYVGGVYYRPVIYGGETVYVVVD